MTDEGEQAYELARKLILFVRNEGITNGFGPVVGIVSLLEAAATLSLIKQQADLTKEEVIGGVRSLFDEICNAKLAKVSPTEFRERYGRDPQQDDLHRVNCEQAGMIGHFHCGICKTHTIPRFMCGCIAETRA